MTMLLNKSTLTGMTPRTGPAALLTALTLAAATACGSGAGTDTSGSAGSQAGGKLAVVAAFYPLQYAAERVGGDRIAVTNLTKPGVEPHDLELTPQDVGKVTTARVAVYAKGFQPTVDKAIAEQSVQGALDVSKDAGLAVHGAGDSGSTVADGHSADDGHDHGAPDPHFWLDPMRYRKVADARSAKRLGDGRPGSTAADYQRNADALRQGPRRPSTTSSRPG